MLDLFRTQPRAFYMIFMLEIWERFGFYTMQGILTLFFMRFMHFSDQQAYYTFGAFSALVYGMISIGGYLGDKVLGTKRTLVLGLVILALGYFALAFAAKAQVFWALGLISVGNGIFKANPSSLLAKCYAKDDTSLHSGFTLYYMAINMGSIAALLLGPALATKYGYTPAYLLSCLGIILGLINFIFQRHHVSKINTPADLRQIFLWQWLIIIAGIALATVIAKFLLGNVIVAKHLVLLITAIVLGIYIFCMLRETQRAFNRMLVALILMIEGVLFFTLYQQMPTSLTLFAVHNVHASLFGLALDPQSLQVLNPTWIIIMGPLLGALYTALHKKNIVFALPYKFAMGMTCCGLSFGILYFARYMHDAAGFVSSGWLIASYLLQSLGELLVSALGVAMVAELVPAAITGFVMGMWFLTSAVSGFLGAFVASFTALPNTLPSGMESLIVYTRVFAYIGLITLGISVFLWLLAPRLVRLMNADE